MVCASLLAGVVVYAQQAANVLGRRSVELHDIGAKYTIRVSVVTKGLSHPWSILWLPDGNMLVTERQGRLRIIRNGVLDPQPIAGVPQVQAGGTSGLLDIALHPKFATNGLVYLPTTSRDRERNRTAPPAWCTPPLWRADDLTASRSST